MSYCKECKASKHREWYKRRSLGDREIDNVKKARYYQEITKGKKRFSKALIQGAKESIKQGYFPCTATKEEIVEAFTGLCHSCGVPEKECKVRLSLDHCHMTGLFRGWLCGPCNRALGLLKNSSDVILSLAEYIEKTH